MMGLHFSNNTKCSTCSESADHYSRCKCGFKNAKINDDQEVIECKDYANIQTKQMEAVEDD